MQNQYRVFVVKTQYEEWKNNVYIVADIHTRDAIIIDPSWDEKKIEDIIDSNNLMPKAILITHSHYDHINVLREVEQFYSIPAYLGEHEKIEECMRDVNIRLISDGERLNLGSIQVEAHETAGHSKGSICYKIGDNFFSGDTLFVEGCGICDNDESAGTLFDSVQKIKKLQVII